MPGSIKQADKLDKGSIPAYQQVGRHLNAFDGLEIGVCRVVKAVAEEVFYFRTAELARRQADVVDDKKRDRCTLRTWPEVRRGTPAGKGDPSSFAK